MQCDSDLHAADLRYQYSDAEKLRIRADTHRLYSKRLIGCGKRCSTWAAGQAVRYYASGSVDRIVERFPDGSHRARLLQLVRRGIEAIIDREGVFRDSKPTGCFVAEVPDLQ